MYKGVYDIFAHYFHDNRGTIYVYSDPHFADPEMKYLRKNYIGDEEQVRRINSKVGKYDTIIFLGDIGDTEWVKKVRGYKVLVMGNHDTGATNYKGIFDEVYEGVLMLSDKILLSHEPVDLSFVYNIHGHVHGTVGNTARSLNVCAEHINYTPVKLTDVIKSGVLGKIETIHRINIDKQNYKKNEESRYY